MLDTIWRRTSWMHRCGFVAVGAGAGLDAVYHLASAVWLPTLDAYLGPDGYRAHLITFLGMLLVLGAVLLGGLQPASRQSGRKEGAFDRESIDR